MSAGCSARAAPRVPGRDDLVRRGRRAPLPIRPGRSRYAAAHPGRLHRSCLRGPAVGRSMPTLRSPPASPHCSRPGTLPGICAWWCPRVPTGRYCSATASPVPFSWTKRPGTRLGDVDPVLAQPAPGSACGASWRTGTRPGWGPTSRSSRSAGCWRAGRGAGSAEPLGRDEPRSPVSPALRPAGTGCSARPRLPASAGPRPGWWGPSRRRSGRTGTAAPRPGCPGSAARTAAAGSARSR